MAPEGATLPVRYTFESVTHLLPKGSDIAEDSPRPDLPRPALVEMREAARLPDNLMGGTRAMRSAHEETLGKEEAETDRNYEIRIKRSTCFPFYKDTLCDLAARPFGRDISWEQDPSDRFDEFRRDVDGTGKSLTVFAKDTLLFGMHRGMDHCLVDASSGSGESADRTDLRRVYAHRIDALALLDVRDKVDDTGRKRVVYCRFVKLEVKETDKFQHEVETIIVELTKEIGDAEGSRVEWRFDEKARRWVASAAKPYNPGSKGIPLFTVYTEQTGHYRAAPVLEDLAWVNLAHFQSRSDHAHVMRVARLITLLTLGWPDDAHPDPNKKQKPIKLGPLSRLNSPKGPQEADARFLEPSGESIDLSFRDMEHLADECKRLGARHLTSKTGNITARAVTTDDQKATNNLQAWCNRIDVYLRQILEAVAEWLNLGELPAKVQPRVWKEFSTVTNPEGSSRVLKELADVLSRRQRLLEAVRNGHLRPDFPVDENLAELEMEAEEAMARLDAQVAAAAGTPGGSDPDELDDGDDGEDGDEDDK
jgi:hypothetical protein